MSADRQPYLIGLRDRSKNVYWFRLPPLTEDEAKVVQAQLNLCICPWLGDPRLAMFEFEMQFLSEPESAEADITLHLDRLREATKTEHVKHYALDPGPDPDSVFWQAYKNAVEMIRLAESRRETGGNSEDPFIATPLASHAEIVQTGADELAVLRALAKNRNRRLVQTDIEAESGLTRKTIGTVLPALVRMGLVAYDSRSRKGAAITPAGERHLEDITGG